MSAYTSFYVHFAVLFCLTACLYYINIHMIRQVFFPKYVHFVKVVFIQLVLKEKPLQGYSGFSSLIRFVFFFFDLLHFALQTFLVLFSGEHEFLFFLHAQLLVSFLVQKDPDPNA